MKKTVFLLFPAMLLLLAGYRPEDRVIPNDPLFKFQLSFLNLGGKLRIPSYSYKPSEHTYEAVQGIDPEITRAWTITTGKKDIIVAFLDDGFFYNHEDIKDNVWKNPGETGIDKNGFPKETNGMDDDGNGYVDDVMGWDFAFDDPDPDPYSFDGMDATKIQPYWHAIETVGIVGAKGNNGIGVAGINWDVSIMFLKIGAQGVRGVDLNRCGRSAKAIRYAADNGAQVINWSGFVDDFRPESLAMLHEAITYAEKKGVLLVVGAGNSGLNIDLKESFTYPACYENENILTVAEIDFKGELYRYKIGDKVRGSNYGVKNVDIAAIGMNFSTFLKNNVSVYALGGGTSCSGPVVTGIAALVLSVCPELKAPELKRVLMESATPLPALKGQIRSGGMVNAYRATKLALSLPAR